MENKISVCIIAKNEENFIRECIESVLPLANEIIVLDTGSTDRTKEIVMQFVETCHGMSLHNVRLYESTWKNDFSKARNECTSYATGDWILSIDADERLTNVTAENIILFIKNNDFTDKPVVLNFKIVEYDQSGTFAGSYYKNIMFRNGFGIHYVSPVHEYLHSEKYNLQQLNCPFLTIVHVGEAGRNNKELTVKKKNYINKLTNLISPEADNQQTCYYYRHLGDEYYELKEYSKALGAYEKAYELAEKRNAFYHSVLSRVEKVLIFHLKDLNKAYLYLQEHLLSAPDSPETLFHIGYCKNRLGEPGEGVKIHKELLESLKMDDLNRALIANLSVEIGRFTGDITYLEKAEAVFPGSKPIKRHILKYYYLKKNFKKASEYFKIINNNFIETGSESLKQEIIKELEKETSWEQWEKEEFLSANS